MRWWLVAAAVCLAAPLAGHQADATITDLGPILPFPTTWAAVATVGHTAYSFGGYDPAQPGAYGTTQVVAFDMVTKTASIVGDPLPEPIVSAWAASDGTSIYLFAPASTTGGGPNYLQQVWQFDPATGHTTVLPVTSPQWHQDGRATWDGSGFDVFAACAAGEWEACPSYRFDPVARDFQPLGLSTRYDLPGWSQRGVALPTTGAHFAMARNLGGLGNESRIVYDVDGAARSALALPGLMTEVRWDDPVALVANRLLMFGGYAITDNPGPGISFEGRNDIIAYDLATGSSYLLCDTFGSQIGSGEAVTSGADVFILGAQSTEVFQWTSSPCDGDLDGVDDASDNCPTVANSDQADADHDLHGDACPTDSDHDGILDWHDNCIVVADATQADQDSDGIGDACDPDLEGDHVYNVLDNCPTMANADQADVDHNRVGDACDSALSDGDFDGMPDASDDCPSIANPNQADLDHDGLGDACDNDVDGDGVDDLADNCPVMSNSNQLNIAHPGTVLGDACEDPDHDGVVDLTDNCPSTPNALQADSNHDGYGDVCQPAPPTFACIYHGVAKDTNGDGVGDICVLVPPTCDSGASIADTNGDGVGDTCLYFASPQLNATQALALAGNTRLSKPATISASFGVSPAAFGVGMQVNFTDNSKNDRPFAAWSWDFGDGFSAVGSHATHKFAAPGLYNVTLLAELGNHELVRSIQHVQVLGPPTLDLADQHVHVGDAVLLDPGQRTNPGGFAISYEWTQLTGPRVQVSGNSTLRFVAPNATARYEVSFFLQATAATGRSTPIVVHVTVDPQPERARAVPTVAVKRIHVEGASIPAPGSALVGGVSVLACLAFLRRRAL